MMKFFIFMCALIMCALIFFLVAVILGAFQVDTILAYVLAAIISINITTTYIITSKIDELKKMIDKHFHK